MRSLSPAIFGWAALASAQAGAASLPADISVELAPAAGGCPGAAELRAAVERIVQSPLSPAGAGPAVQARVRFQRDEVGFEALVHLEGPKPGERRLTDSGTSCAPLAQAVAVTLALLLDGGADVSAPPESPSTRPPVRPTAGLWLASGAAVGLSAAPTLGLGAALAVWWPRWSLQGGGALVVPRDAELPPGRVSVGLSWGDLLLCAAPVPARRVRLDVCAGGAAGWLTGRGRGYPSSSDAGLAWAAAAASAQLGGEVGSRWLWGVAAHALVPLARHSFSIENVGTAYRSDRVAALLELHLGARLW